MTKLIVAFRNFANAPKNEIPAFIYLFAYVTRKKLNHIPLKCTVTFLCILIFQKLAKLSSLLN